MFIDTDFLRSDEIFLKLEKTVEGNTDKDWLPTYHFDICDKFGTKMGAAIYVLVTTKKCTMEAILVIT